MIVKSSLLKQLAGEGKAARPVDELIAAERASAERVAAAVEAQTAILARAIADALAAQKAPVVNLPAAQKPAYTFTIQRDAEGLITGITARPE